MRLFVLAGLTIATPSFAQWYGPSVPSGGYGPRIPVERPVAPGWGGDLRDARDRIDQGRDSGRLSRREARRLDRRADGFGELADRYDAGGLSDAERRELETRAMVLRDQVDARRLGVGTPRTR